jgi:hypothetical protein
MALQESVRDIDDGKTAKVFKIGMIAVILIGLAALYLLVQFKGLNTEAAMDQAQIARSLVSKEGFSTRYIRPLAIRVLSDQGKPTDQENFPEFYNAPLMPLLEAAALWPVKSHFKMSATEIISKGDRAIAVLGIILLFAGVFVWYLVAKELFDRVLALIVAGLLFVTDLMWQYALAGLPHLFLILLFGLMTLCAIRAKKANDAAAEEGGESLCTFLWLGGAALFLGLMSLTHGVAAFLVPGFLAFTLLGFRSPITAFALTIGVYLISVAPWLVHNFTICHNPLGLSSYLALAGSGVSESEIMRGVNTGLSLGGGMAAKLRTNLLDQGAHLWEYLGLNIVVLFFVSSLLHSFRNPVAALWRWMVVLMWFGILVGLALFGVKGAVSGNQLHILFLPIFLIYGTAFMLVLWNRLNIAFPAFRILFLTFVFFLSAVPMLITLLSGQQARIQWPPYVPPFIAILGDWFQPKEALCSDMPWAVAWYANRKCLLLPESLHSFNEISDYNTLGSPIVGLYLTPISGNEKFSELVKGKYKDWGPVIMRTVTLNDFLLKSFTPLPIDGECILYADMERWARKAAQ